MDVTVYTTNANGPDDLDVPCATEMIIDGVRVYYFQICSPRNYFRAPTLKKALRNNCASFDVVYIAWMYVYSTLVAARESLRHGVPYIISPRGMLDKGAIALKGQFKKKLYLTLVEGTHLRGAAKVHFTSEGERQNAWMPGSRLASFVVPNGIEILQKTVEPQDWEITANPADNRLPKMGLVLFLGRLNYIKGLDLLAAAWPMVVSAVPDAQLIIAGPDDDGLYEKYFSASTNSAFLSTVSYIGFVEGEAKQALLNRASLLVSPSYLESFGMSIVEAMANGRPVVVTDRVNISAEIASNNAGVIVPCDARALSAAICTVLLDPPLGARMGRAGRALVENHFALRAVAGTMYRELIEVARCRTSKGSI